MTNKNYTDRLTNLDDFISCIENVSTSLDYLLDREQGNILAILQLIKLQNIESQKIAHSIYKTEIGKLKILWNYVRLVVP